jgi:hypothetical protein
MDEYHLCVADGTERRLAAVEPLYAPIVKQHRPSSPHERKSKTSSEQSSAGDRMTESSGGTITFFNADAFAFFFQRGHYRT